MAFPRKQKKPGKSQPESSVEKLAAARKSRIKDHLDHGQFSDEEIRTLMAMPTKGSSWPLPALPNPNTVGSPKKYVIHTSNNTVISPSTMQSLGNNISGAISGAAVAYPTFPTLSDNALFFVWAVKCGQQQSIEESMVIAGPFTKEEQALDLLQERRSLANESGFVLHTVKVALPPYVAPAGTNIGTNFLEDLEGYREWREASNAVQPTRG